MNRKTYNQITGGIFAIIAFLHLLRIINGWGAAIGGLAIPLWASWIALAVSVWLAWQAFRLK